VVSTSRIVVEDVETDLPLLLLSTKMMTTTTPAP